MPVVPISASKNEGIDELIDTAVQIAQHKTPARPPWISAPGAVHRCHPRHRPPWSRITPSGGRLPAAVRRHQAGGGRRAHAQALLGLTENEHGHGGAYQSPRWSGIWTPTGRLLWRTCATPLSSSSAHGFGGQAPARVQGAACAVIKIDKLLTHKYLAHPHVLGDYAGDLLADLRGDRQPISKRSAWPWGSTRSPNCTQQRP